MRGEGGKTFSGRTLFAEAGEEEEKKGRKEAGSERAFLALPPSFGGVVSFSPAPLPTQFPLPASLPSFLPSFWCWSRGRRCSWRWR